MPFAVPRSLQVSGVLLRTISLAALLEDVVIALENLVQVSNCHRLARHHIQGLVNVLRRARTFIFD